MGATNKVGTQLLVSPHTLDRGRALAIVRHERVAEVWRAALEQNGLIGLEKQHLKELEELAGKLAKRPDDNRSELLATWARHGAPAA